ncbi:MAG: SGNH/GDSL hydrolase family protein [Gemmatimonadales bacterium]|nr:SGNH/GDSL hydrolase family protein [Gemmatimonadales bacterium]
MTEIRMIALGDSYTIGEGVAEDQRWPAQLADSLASRGVSVTGVEYIAKTGWTTTDLLTALRADPKTGPPYDLVSLLIGVNNQFANMDINLYRDEFTELLEMAVALAGGRPERVLVLSVPDYGVTPRGHLFGPDRIRDEIDQYNVVNRSIAQSSGALYADITPLSRLAADDPMLVARDGLHFTGKMYALWVAHLVSDLHIDEHIRSHR